MTAVPRPAVLLVDDEPHSLVSMRMALEDEFDVFTAADATAAAQVLDQEWVQVILWRPADAGPHGCGVPDRGA
jgi:two-component system response regulator HupR/HoxA